MLEITMISLLSCFKLGISVPFYPSAEDVHIWSFTGDVGTYLPIIDKHFYLFVFGLTVIFSISWSYEHSSFCYIVTHLNVLQCETIDQYLNLRETTGHQ